MKKRITAVYSAACAYEIIKIFYIASFVARCTQDMLLFKYYSIAAVCVPALLWFMLALNEKAFYWALYAAALFKFSSICAEALYIFHKVFAIISQVLNQTQKSGGFGFVKDVFFFFAADSVVLFYLFIRGSVYYANNTDC